MEAVNGVKIYQIGDDDWVYASNKEEALEVMLQLVDLPTVKEMSDCYFQEITDSAFNTGKMHYDVNGQLDIIDSPILSFKEVLLDTMKDGSTSGHFMTTEY